ncbi:MAG: Hsp70 family protein, partial [Lachnospiraceae bacterium]|nr:Hsp70 family protein [Lachnospiraceae bacterium]
MSDQIIGIDLGTSTTEASYIKDGKPMMLQDSHDRIVIPSAVGIDAEGKWVVGEAAKAQYVLFPERTAIEIKRKIGTGDMIPLCGKDY